MAARELQSLRFVPTPHTGQRKMQPDAYCNAQMNSAQLEKHCSLGPEARQLLSTAMNKLQLSARAYDRILKVARTIADLDASERIAPQHIAGAIQFRTLDRASWGQGI